MSKHRPPGALQGQSRQQRHLFPPPIIKLFSVFLIFIFGYERGLDLKVSYKFSSILGMLTDAGT